MKLIVAFYDKKTESWSDLVTVPNQPTACRMCEQIVKREGSIQNQYPGDFDLYVIAEYCESIDGNLDFSVCTPKRFVCSCTDFVSKPQE